MNTRITGTGRIRWISQTSIPTCALVGEIKNLRSKSKPISTSYLPWNFSHYFFVLSFRNLQQPDLLQDRFDSWLVKCAISLFNSFYSNVVNQVARFCWPFYRPLNKTTLQFAAKTKPSFLNMASFSKIFFNLNHISIDKDPLSKGIFTRTKIEINL